MTTTMEFESQCPLSLFESQPDAYIPAPVIITSCVTPSGHWADDKDEKEEDLEEEGEEGEGEEEYEEADGDEEYEEADGDEEYEEADAADGTVTELDPDAEIILEDKNSDAVRSVFSRDSKESDVRRDGVIRLDLNRDVTVPEGTEEWDSADEDGMVSENVPFAKLPPVVVPNESTFIPCIMIPETSLRFRPPPPIRSVWRVKSYSRSS
jgi:hypothetical protein